MREQDIELARPNKSLAEPIVALITMRILERRRAKVGRNEPYHRPTIDR
jgi:hypothetical protein